MRIQAAVLLSGMFAIGSASAQNNATAGLAGVGAGLALGGASSQSATASSSVAGGGGNTPIEIQIMVFQGLQKIAAEITAEITKLPAFEQAGCKQAFEERDSIETEVETYRERLQTDLESLDRDNIALHKDNEDQGWNTAKLNVDREKIQKDQEELSVTKSRLEIALNNQCAILVEDSTSANQVALYEAVQGYYDHLHRIDDQLQDYFSLQIISSLSFPYMIGKQTISAQTFVTNVGKEKRKIKDIVITGSPAFEMDLGAGDCGIESLDRNQGCTIPVSFPKDGVPVEEGRTYSGTISITSGEADSSQTDTIQTIQLTGTVTSGENGAVQGTAPGRKAPPVASRTYTYSGLAPSTATATATSAGSTSTSGATSAAGSSTPIGLTYLGDLTTALGSLKSNITYGSSTFQPTTQSLQLLMEAELKENYIFPYTSTSALNLQKATDTLSYQFGQMIAWTNDITNWENQCKPATGGPMSIGNGASPPNSACTLSVIQDLSVAQQLINGYTTLLASPSDGNGNPVIIDVLRGAVLSEKMAEGIPSLQVSVAAAGGSTKTNNFFGVSLFYTFAPSYNAGVIVTFELRDKKNVLLEQGARNALFAYGKWKSGHFVPAEMKSATCGSFCSVK